MEELLFQIGFRESALSGVIFVWLQEMIIGVYKLWKNKLWSPILHPPATNCSDKLLKKYKIV